MDAADRDAPEREADQSSEEDREAKRKARRGGVPADVERAVVEPDERR